MPQSTCRWAALSLSNIASVFLPDILLPRGDLATDDVLHKLVAVSTTGTSERASKWFVQNKIDQDGISVYYSWQRMLEEGDFDVVYISTPHPLHLEHVRKALKCKRNVLVEKPATMTRAQYEWLADYAVKQNVVLMEAMWTRYLPATRYLQEELLPKIGQVKRVIADFSFPIVSPELDVTSRFLDKEAGAGALLDQGVYALTWADVALHVSSNNKVNVIHANSMAVPGVADSIDDINTVVLASTDEQSGRQTAVGIVTTSMTLPGSNKPAFYRRLQAKKPGPCVIIQATEAQITVPFPPIRPQELHVQWYGREHVDEEGMEVEEVIERPVERGWGIWYQADVMAKEVLKRQSGDQKEGMVIGAEESLRVLGYMDAARRLAGISYPAELERMPGEGKVAI